MNRLMSKDKFVFIEKRDEDIETIRPSLTYWQDAWRRLKQNKLSVIGMFTVVLILLFGFVGPKFRNFSYSDQVNKYKNLPPRLDLYEIKGKNFYLSKDYNMFLVEPDGTLIDRLNMMEKY